jgi:dolichol kinase
MEPSSHLHPKASLKGTAGLVIALGVVAALLVALPAYRWFFLISVGIGLAVAAILFLWHRVRPIQDKDVDNKRPLGLG